MKKRVHRMVQSAVLAALYIALSHGQNLLLPGSASLALQLRVSEALCILAYFTPAAISGLGIGCLVFNLTAGSALPLDFLIGTLATVLGAWGTWRSRRITIKGYPLPGLLMPVASNALLVGWELCVYLGGGFWMNALYVATGEAAVLLSLGTALYYALKNRKLDKHLFALL